MIAGAPEKIPLARRLYPIIDRMLPLAEAANAHRLLAQRGAFGEVLLKT